MTTIKTDDLTPRQINMLVAVAEGWVPPSDPLVKEWKGRVEEQDGPRRWHAPVWLDTRDLSEVSYHYSVFDYCRIDTHAGPIIDRERIATAWMGEQWAAFSFKPARNPSGYNGERYIDVDVYDADGVAATRLEAAMRAHVRRFHGDEIDTTDKPWLLEAAAS